MLNSEEFVAWRKKNSRVLENDPNFQSISLQWLNVAAEKGYSYMFQWMGEPIIQFPSDILLIQEAVYRSKANKIVEVGIARGGMTLFLASLLKLLDKSENSMVIGVDIQLSSHTLKAIENSSLKSNVKLVEGDSATRSTLDKVLKYIEDDDRVLVILDSNHAKNHVYAEMTLFGDVVSKNSFLIVMDTAIEYLESESIGENKPWSRNNSPKSAIDQYFSNFPENFSIDEDLNSRSFPGAAYGGFLRKN